MKVQSNGITLHVEDQGAGDVALIFLHYWGGSSRTWKYVTSELATDHRTIAIDQRGWGQSAAANDGYDLATLSADIAGVINALNVRRYVLVGHSMGGKVAQLMASRRPAGLAGLVLVAPSPPTPMALPVPAREAMAGAYDSRATIEATIDNVLVAKPLCRADREQVIEDSLKGAPAAKISWPRNTSQEDISRHVGNIDVPTLVIAGELDQVDTPEILKGELKARLPRADLHILKGTGHLSMLESPGEVVGLVRCFCKQLVELAG
ncbi:alpha/beta fold hydrolase [Thalassospira sp. MCCC 1A01428]|uniref:alpha/beta fold hydrolase n=1 Tax=unclassified Thalassospira TaxID=2648997 RepID=UPI000A1F9E09|nr:alpha/beta hydrolase [Thalassospira sp. MCCC 1A01428]OSQ41974.1 hydrolase [Thalassospira sp. MCCC 1A01428]